MYWKDNYFSGSTPTITRSKEVENLKSKMKERWQIQEMTISFNRNNLKLETNHPFENFYNDSNRIGC